MLRIAWTVGLVTGLAKISAKCAVGNWSRHLPKFTLSTVGPTRSSGGWWGGMLKLLGDKMTLFDG